MARFLETQGGPDRVTLETGAGVSTVVLGRQVALLRKMGSAGGGTARRVAGGWLSG